MTSRLPKKMLHELKEARKAATLESASFDWEDSRMTVKCRSGDFEGRPDTFIKQRVELYHKTWIIARLDAVIAWANGTEPA